MTADRARLFFALWPDEAVRAALSGAAKAAQAECSGRTTAAEKIHLTLFFLGSVDRARLPHIEKCAAALAARRFTLDMSVLGYWRHNRIVWAGASACPAELRDLVSGLTANLAAEGIAAEDRPYVPHATLVRDARRPPSLRTLQAPPWDARELVLVESVASQRGARYEIVSRFPLE